MKRNLTLSAVCAILLFHGCSQEELAPAGVAASASDSLEGHVLSSSGGPEAGVWVIAETDDLPTPYRKIVVTDDLGRFVLPELPPAEYQVWVRGYGLRDSPKSAATLGGNLDLTVTAADSPRQAAAIYPASYWLSLLHAPGQDPHWINRFKLGCQLCHQVGSLATRSLNRSALDVGLQKASYMNVTADALGRDELLGAMADWQQRISAGEVPAPPPRPQGLERNLVITQWGWGDKFTYAHDEIATDKREPTRYAHGPIYGVDLANDQVLSLDPTTHTATASPTPTLHGHDTPWCRQTYKPLASAEIVPVGFGSLGCPSTPGLTAYEGQYPNPANPHNPMLDDQGRVWITTQVRREWAEDLPSFCRNAPVIGDNYHHRQLGWYAPASGEYELIDTCYGTHHLQFDGNGVLWTSGDSYVIGWFDPDRYDPARPESLNDAQGWSEIVIDTDGDGAAETPIVDFNYGVIPNPLDGSVWTAQPGGDPGGPMDFAGRLIRYDPTTNRHEAFAPPAPGAGPRGVDVDTRGVIWVALGGSGHLGRFDRTRCIRTWGDGSQCPEGWSLYRSPGPVMRTGNDGSDERAADFHYYLFVDQFNTFGLGADVVVMNGTGSDSLLAFDPKTEAFTIIRIPYPLNSYTRGLDGRIDDPAAGWKGRGLWFTNGLDPMIHSEITQSYVGHVQLRPDPLAR